MNLATAPLRDLAARLLAEECERTGTSGPSSAVQVCEKFGRVISQVAGRAGYRSLLSRALAFAQDEVPGMAVVHVSQDGQLEGFADARATTDTDEFTRGEVSIVAHLLGLLHTFIGEPLTEQLVKEAWPAILPPSS